MSNNKIEQRNSFRLFQTVKLSTISSLDVETMNIISNKHFHSQRINEKTQPLKISPKLKSIFHIRGSPISPKNNNAAFVMKRTFVAKVEPRNTLNRINKVNESMNDLERSIVVNITDNYKKLHRNRKTRRSWKQPRFEQDYQQPRQTSDSFIITKKPFHERYHLDDIQMLQCKKDLCCSNQSIRQTLHQKPTIQIPFNFTKQLKTHKIPFQRYKPQLMLPQINESSIYSNHNHNKSTKKRKMDKTSFNCSTPWGNQTESFVNYSFSQPKSKYA